MRPWVLLLLLLLSLLVSGLMPPGDGDWVMDYFSWTLCRKLILGGQMAPRRLTQTDCRCMCFKRAYMYAVLQQKHWSYSFCWSYTVYSNNGHALSFQDLRRLMEKNHIPELAVPHCYSEGKPVPAFLMNSNTALLLISDTPPTKPVGKTSHIALDIIQEGPDSRPPLLVRHHSAASGQNLQASSPEKSEGWTATISAPLQKTLTKRFCVATTVIASCCPKRGEKISKLNIRKTSKGEAEPPQIKQKGAMDIKTLIQSNQRGSLRASVSQHDIFHAAALHSGTSSMKTSEMSRLETQRHETTLMKKRQHLNSNEDSTWRRSFQKQLSLKAASGVDDGEKKGSIKRPLRIRPAQDDNELFSGKMITKQAELRYPKGDRKTGQNANTMENRNQMRLAYILQTHSTHKTDIHDFNEKQMLSDVGDEALIMFFLPEAEMDPTSERKLIPNTDIRRRVNVPELGDPLPITKALKDITTERDASKHKCFKGRKCLLEIYVIDRTERLDRKEVEHEKTVEERVEETAEKTENPPTADTHDGTTGSDPTKHEGTRKTEETVTSSPPPLKMLTTEHTTDTTTVNTTSKDTTISTDAINRSSAEKDDGQPSAEESPTTTVSRGPEAHTEPGFMRSKTETTQAKTEKPLSGLRMREDVLGNINKFLKGTESEGGALMSRTEMGRKEDQNDPGVDSFTFSTHLETNHKGPSDRRAKISGDTVPLCRGLIHRTQAGWKHCTERLGGMRDPVNAGEPQRESISDNDNNHLNDEGNDHFYYFDGVLKRVQNHFYPHYKRETHYGVPAERQKKDTRENLLSYIRRLTLRNRVGDFKRLGAEDDVQRHGQ